MTMYFIIFILFQLYKGENGLSTFPVCLWDLNLNMWFKSIIIADLKLTLPWQFNDNLVLC